MATDVLLARVGRILKALEGIQSELSSANKSLRVIAAAHEPKTHELNLRG